MRLLITRPLPDALATEARVRALGHETLVQPLLTIVFAPPPKDLPEPAAILATSRNSIRAIQAWPLAKRWQQTPIFVTGEATARDAADAGFADVRSGGGDVASLGQAVRAAFPPGAGPLLYATARDRAGELAEAVTAAGYEVRIVEAYRAEMATAFDRPVREALAGGRLDGVLLYSRRTAEAFRALATAAGLAEHLRRPAYYVLSEQVAAALKSMGSDVRRAARPDEDSLLALIGPAR
jgi:uroporphyrinogen-III synthase